jgi:signal peptidase I
MKKLEIFEIIEVILTFLLIFLPVRFFIFEPFIVMGESMEPNYHTADYLIICKICTKIQPVQRGDVIVFIPPVDERKYYIKRVIGLPGETVYLKGRNIYIYNKENPNGFKLEEPYLQNEDFDLGEEQIQLKDDEYFVLGDNRNESFDSRKWGPLKKDRIIGKVSFKISPLGRLIKIIKFNNL